jgi:hypothetical protein
MAIFAVVVLIIAYVKQLNWPALKFDPYEKYNNNKQQA